MTRSNRVGNRLIILLVGLVSIGVGVALELPRFGSTLSLAAPTAITLASSTLWIALAVCVGVIVLSVIWIVTRGRGRTAHLVAVTDTTGSTTIDARVVADLLSDALTGNRAVASIGSGAWRMRRQTVLSIRLVARKGAHVPDLIRSVGTAVEELDVVLERRIPILLQIVSEPGVRTVRTR